MQQVGFDLTKVDFKVGKISVKSSRYYSSQGCWCLGGRFHTSSPTARARKTLDMEGFRHLSYRHFRHVFSAHCSNQTTGATANKNRSQMIDINLLFQLVHCNPKLAMWLRSYNQSKWGSFSKISKNVEILPSPKWWFLESFFQDAIK